MKSSLKQINALTLSLFLLSVFPTFAYADDYPSLTRRELSGETVPYEVPDTLNMKGFTADVIPYEIQNVRSMKGFAEDAIPYAILDISSVWLTANSLAVTRQVSYDGFTVPPSELDWEETRNGVVYSGTLKLKSYSFNPKTQKTIAYYEGTLTAQ